MKGKKLVIAVILALIVCLVLIPTCAFADSDGLGVKEEVKDNPPVVEEKTLAGEGGDNLGEIPGGDEELGEGSGEVIEEETPDVVEEDKSDDSFKVGVVYEGNSYEMTNLKGGEEHILKDVLSKVGITGNIESASTEAKVFSVKEEEDGWKLITNSAFNDTYILKVTVDGKEYTFTVYDDNVPKDVSDLKALQEALADTTVTTIKITDNITFTDTNLEVANNREVTLDLNGKTLTGNCTATSYDKNTKESTKTRITVYGKLKITDSSTDGEGKVVFNNLVNDSAGIYAKGAGAEFTLESGSITSSQYGVACFDGGSAVIEGGSITSNKAAVSGNNTLGDMNFEVHGGTLTSETGPAIYMPGQVNLIITGGTMNGGVCLRMGQVKISGGTINARTSGYAENANDWYKVGSEPALADALYVIGGTYTSENKEGNSLNLDITGGTFNCTNGKGSAVAVYAFGKETQDMKVEISDDAKLYTNAKDRNAYDVLSLEEAGVTKPDSGYTTHAESNKAGAEKNTSVTGGVFSDDKIKEYVNEDKVAVLSANGKTAIASREKDGSIATIINEAVKSGEPLVVVNLPFDALVSAPEGLTIVNESGKTITVNGVAVVSGASYTVPVKPAATPLSAKYFVIEGKNQQWTAGNIEFKLNSKDVVKILIDGVEVEFTVAEDGTVTIASAVIEKLESGLHEIEFVYADGSCKTVFTVK